MLYLSDMRTAVTMAPTRLNESSTSDRMAVPGATWEVLKWFVCCIIVTFAGLIFSFRITENLHTQKASDRTSRRVRHLSFSSLGQVPLYTKGPTSPATQRTDQQLIDRLTKELLPLIGSGENKPKDPREVNAMELMQRVFKDYVLPEPDCSKKLLVYECSDNQTHCYGLGDRERGMVTTFLLALLTNRTFCVQHTRPCLLSNYFEPNLYNWSKCLSEYNSTTDVHYVTMMGKKGNLPDLATVPAGDLWENKAVVVRTNSLIFKNVSSNPNTMNILPWAATTNARMIPHTLYHILFKLERSLQDKVDRLIEKMTLNGTRSLIGVHIRGVFFDLNDTKYVFAFLDRFSNKSKYAIYLATDVEEIKTEATEWFTNVHTLNSTGLSLHVDNLSATCDSMQLAVLEQQILARSDILIKTRSAYSQQAHIIRGDRGIAYQFRGSKQNAEISFTKSSDFNNEKIAIY